MFTISFFIYTKFTLININVDFLPSIIIQYYFFHSYHSFAKVLFFTKYFGTNINQLFSYNCSLPFPLSVSFNLKFMVLLLYYFLNFIVFFLFQSVKKDAFCDAICLSLLRIRLTQNAFNLPKIRNISYRNIYLNKGIFFFKFLLEAKISSNSCLITIILRLFCDVLYVPFISLVLL